MKQDNYIKIPELRILIEKEVHDKDKTWNELKLDEHQHELLSLEQCIWLVNSRYAEELKMDGKTDDDFYIRQPINLNKRNGYVGVFSSHHGYILMQLNRSKSISNESVGVRFYRVIENEDNSGLANGYG